MANHKSAEKRAVQSVKLQARNSAVKSMVRTSIARFDAAVKAGSRADAARFFAMAQAEIDTAKRKGVLHSNTAARKVSALSMRLKAIAA